MSTSATRTKLKLQCTLAAALSLAAVSAFAQVPKSRMIGVYGGATAGIGASQWSCTTYTACNRAAFSGKAFAGYRMTPGLAAEINYIYFGSNERSNDGAKATATGIATDRQTTRTATVGVNWEVELLHHFTNHLRIGWAFNKTTNDIVRANGTGVANDNYYTAPYVGAGLSFRVTENVRMVSNFDYIVAGHDSNYLFSIGAAADF